MNHYNGDELFTFSDVLIEPQFSEVGSRKNVDLSTNLYKTNLKLPIISANMDTITEIDMAKAMAVKGGIGALHRFCSIEDNITMFKNGTTNNTKPIVSFGLGDKELDRAVTLYNNGAELLLLDIAHAAQIEAVRQVKKLLEVVNNNAGIVVGNFATANTINTFAAHVGRDKVRYYKVGIGSSKVCSTRGQTGIGIPQLSAVIECVRNTGMNIISDGGHAEVGDIAKSLGAGACAVMLGGMLSATEESPGEVTFPYPRDAWGNLKSYKEFKGSASKESYTSQGKEASWRAPEGVKTLLPYKGSVTSILDNIEGGLRSSFTYVGAKNLDEYHNKVKFVRISNNVTLENKTYKDL